MLCCLCGAVADVRAGDDVRDFSGVAASGAWYRIAVPAGWHSGDALVMYQHGLDFSAATEPPGLGPLSEVMLGEGYAIAATSYRERGWAMFSVIEDNRELLDVFETLVGVPAEIIPFGGSLGGLAALKLAEARAFPPVRGAYVLCPAAAGSRIWDAAIDLRLAYDVVCDGAGDLPTGTAPIPWALDLRDIPDDLGNLLDQAQLLDVLVPLNQCTGINLPPALRSQAMQQRLARLMAFMHVTDEDFLVSNIGYAVYVMSDLVRAPEKLAGRNPFTTAGVDYGEEPSIDAGIVRLVEDTSAARDLRLASDFLGAVGDAKILSMHTSRDELVIPGNQDFVLRALPPDQRTVAIVAEDAPSHCGFSAAEGVAGWEALRAWSAGAPQPDVTDLQAQCVSLEAAGILDGPCRFDPDARIVPFDDVVRPRPHAPAIARSHSRHARPRTLPIPMMPQDVRTR